MKRPLSSLSRWAQNYRKNDVQAIAKSIEEFGYNGVLCIRGDTVYAGNGSLAALFLLKGRKVVPAGIEVDSAGEWLIPVADLSHLTELQAAAFAIAHNKTQEAGSDDKEALESLLAMVSGAQPELLDSWMDTQEIASLLNATNHEETDSEDAGEQLDRAAELGQKWGTAVGQVWKLGSHRLVIGDCTDGRVRELALSGNKVRTIVTDPPYGVKYDASWREEYRNSDGQRLGKVQNDDQVLWMAHVAALGADVLYIWHAGVFAGEVALDMKNQGYEIRSQIIWAKEHFVLSRGAYHWQHEPCYYAVRKGADANWQGDRTQSTLWQVVGSMRQYKNQSEEDAFVAGHSTQKPVELYERAYRNHCTAGEYVIDPFAGSGSGLVAAQKCKLYGIAIELDASYGGAIIERLSLMNLSISKESEIELST